MAKSVRETLLAVVTAGLLASCSGGGEDGGGQAGPPPPPPPPGGPTGRMATPAEAGLFLTQATFGPGRSHIEQHTGRSASTWFERQLDIEPTYLTPIVDQYTTMVRDPDSFSAFRRDSATLAFWRNAIGAPDQLRQRMAFALSQILVVSADTSGRLGGSPEGMAYYQDLMIEHAFGNYRDLLEDVTYSPAMGDYLTYIGSKKANPNTGRMPDENYARELLQLFTIGVVEIDQGGEVVTSGGAPVELFDNDDVTGLARVFTGFEFALRGDTDANRRERMRQPLVIDPNDHSEQAKSFLGLTIPAGVSAEESVDQALDHIMAQPTTAPFISRQLIQRFTTSDPSPDYVRRVANAFEAGRFTLPNAETVGDGRRGDLAATLAAILFDPSVSDIDAARADDSFGKVREPVLRLAHWARAFEVPAFEVVYMFDVYNTSGTDDLSQTPYRSPSVFNFYRPGFVAPGTLTGEAGMTAPELQILNSATAAGYVNFMDDFILDDPGDRNVNDLQRKINAVNVTLSAERAAEAWLPDLTYETALASDHEALVDHLALILTNDALSDGTRGLVLEQLDAEAALGTDTPEEIRDRVQIAILLIMSSPDYLVQR